MDIELYPLLKEHNKYHNTYGTMPLTGKAPRYHVAGKYKPALAFIDLIGSCIFFPMKLRRQPKSPKKILIIRLDHLGDIIMTLPAYAALRKLYPKAEIHALVRSFTKDVFYNNKNIDKIITFDPPWFARDKKSSFKQLISFLLELRREKYDIVIELHADPRNILAATVIGGYRVGYGIRGFGFLLNKKVVYKKFNHLVETNLDIIRALGYSGKTPMEALTLSYTKDDAKKAEKLVPEKSPVMINPGTGRPNKYWMPERWAEVADALIDSGRIVCLTGSNADISECEKIAGFMRNKPKILAGKTSMGALFALIKKSALVLAPDTGISHFAACLKTPCITLFGPIPPAICNYSSSVHKSIVKTLPCSYCAKPVCPRKDRPNECMKLITSKEVIAMAKRILARR